jgi:hypothetical protein
MSMERERRIVVVRDGEEVSWRVREVDGETVPAARGSRCLIFDSESAVRRVWDYPADWRDLPPGELAAVSWRR